jgi:N-acetylmuramoyl-L-alanine amidase
LFQNLSKINRSLVNRGVKTAPFAVLAATEMPAILTEVSCLSNGDEARLLATPEYRQHIAQALLQGIQPYVLVPQPLCTERELIHESYERRPPRGY